MPEHQRENLLTHISLLATSHAKQQAEITRLKAEGTIVKQMLTVTSEPLGAPVLVMTDFQQHKRDDDQWNSPPVYTHHQGYKICLRVFANGIIIGEGTHVTVSVFFMRGEFDDSLKWPFRGVISYQLLDQVNANNHKTYTHL